MGKELVTVCLLSNFLSTEQILLGLQWHVYDNEGNVDQNESYLAEGRMFNLYCKSFYAQQQQHNWIHQQTRTICFLLTSAEESTVRPTFVFMSNVLSLKGNFIQQMVG